METINQHFGFDSPKALQDWMDALFARHPDMTAWAPSGRRYIYAPGFEAWFTPDFLKSLQ